jgi:hypothetical protein
MNFRDTLKQWVAEHQKFTADQMPAQRMATCDQCEFKNGSRCGKCGCNLNLKTLLMEFHCPIGKW